MCQVVAVIKDKAAAQSSQTVCGGEGRIKNVYYSASNELEVRFVLKTNSEEQKYVLLEYTG